MNKKYFAKTLIILDLLGYCITKEFSRDLAEVYFIQPCERDKIIAQVLHPEFREIKSALDVSLVLRFTELYGVNFYGNSSEEKELIKLKGDIFEAFSREFEKKDICKLSLWKNINAPLSKRIIGLIYYYGLDKNVNTKIGKKLLDEAAQDGDIDALLWCLYHAKDSEKNEYVEKILSLPESFAFTEWLEIFKANYKCTNENVAIGALEGKRRIGF
jgi:hypothetical protein